MFIKVSNLWRKYADHLKVIGHVSSSWNGSEGNKVTPVTMSPLADIMKLSFEDSKKYAGILDMPALCKLQEEFTIEYNARIVAPESLKRQKAGMKKEKLPGSSHECQIRIVVYGVKSEAYAVGQLLSGAGLYLQQPSATEVYKHLEYWNPHYLLRPGALAPKLEILSISADKNNVASSDCLDESQKSRFMQIFNSACGPISFFKATPSLRLKSTLKE